MKMNRRSRQRHDEDKENLIPSDFTTELKTPKMLLKKQKFFTNILSSPSSCQKQVINSVFSNDYFKDESSISLFYKSEPPGAPLPARKSINAESLIDVTEMWNDNVTMLSNCDLNSFQSLPLQKTISISDISIIKKTTKHEQCSEDEFDIDQFNSTFGYPLHSTLKSSPIKSDVGLGPLHQDVHLTIKSATAFQNKNKNKNLVLQPIRTNSCLTPLENLQNQFGSGIITNPVAFRVHNKNRRIKRTAKLSPNLRRIERLESTLTPTKSTSTRAQPSSLTGKYFAEEKPVKLSVIDSEEMYKHFSKQMSEEVMIRKRITTKENEYTLTPTLKSPVRLKKDFQLNLPKKECQNLSDAKHKMNFYSTPDKSDKENDLSLTLVSEAFFDESTLNPINYIPTRQYPNQVAEPSKLPQAVNRSIQTETTSQQNQPYSNPWPRPFPVPFQYFNIHPLMTFQFPIVPNDLLFQQRLHCPGMIDSTKSQNACSYRPSGNAWKSKKSRRKISKRKIMAAKSLATNSAELVKNSKFSVLAVL